MPSKNKFLSRLKALYIGRNKTGTALNTTLSANVAKGATSITVAAITNGTDGEAIRIGSGNDAELNKISGAPSGSTINLAWPTQRAHVTGEAAREVTIFDHGAPDEGGVDFFTTGETVDVAVSTQRMPIASVKGYQGAGAEGAWPYFDLFTFATALGMDLAKVTGSGTAASPRQLITDGNEMGEEIDVFVVAAGVLVDGTEAWLELWGCTMDYTAVNSTLGRGNPPRIPFRARASAGGVMTTTAPGYAIDTTYRASKTKVWRALTEVGIRSPSGSGVDTTLTAAAAAGAVSLTVDDSTGAAAGDRVKVGTGSDAEYPIVADAPDANTITLRTKLLRGHVIGEAVVEQAETAFAGITEAGLSLQVSGSVRPVRIATSPLEAGIIPGDAMVTLGFNLGDIILANFARALGIPQAAIVGARLPVDVEIGTEDIDALYAKGVLQNGDIVVVDAWGFAQIIQEVRTKLSNRDISSIPVSGKPATLQLLQYQ